MRQADRYIKWRLKDADLDASDPQTMNDDDLDGWMLGPNVRTRGSVHPDVWYGNATALAAKRHIAVFPVGGWWKDWPQSGRVGATVRYSLEADIDIYTPIATEIGIAVPIA